jgi:dTDP-4-dehydrorhamnose 3,5-epimerase
MRFQAASLTGVYEIELERHPDERGFFARTWCTRELAAHGLPENLVQSSLSHNARKGTVRGMHFQWAPSQEGKVVRCEHGAVHDVLIDLRPDSTTYLQHYAVQLEADRGNAVYIPPGIAHGFQTLVDYTRVIYLMTDFYAPELADGLRHDDPGFAIEWPLETTVISERDRAYPDFDRARHLRRATGAP